MANLVAILAIPRTGTNFIGDLINKFNEIDSLYEIFHKKSVYLGNNQQLNRDIINHINQKYGLSIENTRSEEFINFTHTHPHDFLNTIEAKSSNKYASFKIFPNHLTRETMRDVVIKNHNIIKIVVKRNLLDAYLSRKISQQNKKGKHDTSEFKLDFDDGDFLDWFAFQNDYYDFIETELRNSGQDVKVVQYEEIHNHQNNRDKIQYLFDFFQSAGLQLDRNNLSEILQKDLEDRVREKQDPRNSRLEKLSNPKSLIDTLASKELDYLLT